MNDGTPPAVIPANAGTHRRYVQEMGPRFRGDGNVEVFGLLSAIATDLSELRTMSSLLNEQSMRIADKMAIVDREFARVADRLRGLCGDMRQVAVAVDAKFGASHAR